MQKRTSSSSNFVPDDDIKLVPALRPHIHQITGVVWAAPRRWDIRKGIFHDLLSPIEAGGTENVSFHKPVSFGLWPVAHSDCLGDLFLAVQPRAQFLGAVLVDNSDLIFTTVVVRHVFSPDVFYPWRVGMDSETDFLTKCYVGCRSQSIRGTLYGDAFSETPLNRLC